MQLLFIRRVMNTVNGGTLCLLQAIGNGPVRREHALFNKPVRRVPRCARDSDGLTFWAEKDISLRKIEVETSPLRPAGMELLGQRGQRPDLILKRGGGSDFGGLLDLPIFQYRSRPGIGELRS